MQRIKTFLFSESAMRTRSGFTLIETLAAITLLMLAIVAPMSLAEQSLSAAYYARDQITAFYLAQEAIEVVRSVRDGNILTIAEGGTANIFDGIPLSTPGTPAPFTVNSLAVPASALVQCSGACPPLQTDGTVYGYHTGWSNTIFTRTVTATEINSSPDELRIAVTVSWQEGNFQTRTFTLNEDLYRWVNDDTNS